RASQVGRDQGPPSDAQGNTTSVYDQAIGDVRCTAQGWLCQHRLRSVANMVAFRKATSGAPLVRWWDDGANRIAFARGDKGFVVINRDAAVLHATFDTGLSPGNYCDVLDGDFASTGCTGKTAQIDADGKLELTVQAYSAAAFHVGARL